MHLNVIQMLFDLRKSGGLPERHLGVENDTNDNRRRPTFVSGCICSEHYLIYIIGTNLLACTDRNTEKSSN